MSNPTERYWEEQVTVMDGDLRESPMQYVSVALSLPTLGALREIAQMHIVLFTAATALEEGERVAALSQWELIYEELRGAVDVVNVPPHVRAQWRQGEWPGGEEGGEGGVLPPPPF